MGWLSGCLKQVLRRMLRIHFQAAEQHRWRLDAA